MAAGFDYSGYECQYYTGTGIVTIASTTATAPVGWWERGYIPTKVVPPPRWMAMPKNWRWYHRHTLEPYPEPQNHYVSLVQNPPYRSPARACRQQQQHHKRRMYVQRLRVTLRY